jgi:hypothetical protein
MIGLKVVIFSSIELLGRYLPMIEVPATIPKTTLFLSSDFLT